MTERRPTMTDLSVVLASLFAVVALVVEFRGSWPGEEWTLVRLERWFGTSLDDMMVAVGAASDSVVLAVFAAVVAMWFAWSGRRADAVVFAGFVAACMLTNPVMKEVFARPRPQVRPHPESVSTFSFPSGHASGTLAVALAFLLVARSLRARKIAIVAGGGMVALVGFSRIAIAVHYPSDILAGWLWVGALGAVTWAATREESGLERDPSRPAVGRDEPREMP